MLLTAQTSTWQDPDGRKNTAPIIGAGCRVEEGRVVCRRLAVLDIPQGVFEATIWDEGEPEEYELIWPPSIGRGYHREVTLERAR